jgi:hypothetical protein
MNLEWRKLALPEIAVPEERPTVPEQVLAKRCVQAYEIAEVDWLVVYADREHSANLTYLTNFDPRFEEAILLLGPADQRILLVGNEGMGYASQAGLDLEFVLCQPLSLMGQDRTRAPSLVDVLGEAGIGSGQSIGLVGWKYLEPEEQSDAFVGIFVPAVLVDGLRTLAGDPLAVHDATWVLMHATKGLRATNDVNQIAVFEWAASRATHAIHNIVRSIRPGLTEFQAVSNMRFAGEPLSAHVMFASGHDEIVGLRSPTARIIQRGDGATTAVGYWGGLGCRAGLVEEDAPDFLEKLALPYYRGIVTWYQSVRLGAQGSEIFQAVAEVLDAGNLRSLLNPGHLTSYDEWVNTPVRPGSVDLIHSGMAFQCDIIPTPLPPGWAVNCEDPLIFADKELRGKLDSEYPAVSARIEQRRKFMTQELGIEIADEVLPLSSMPAYFPPLWLSPSKGLALT